MTWKLEGQTYYTYILLNEFAGVVMAHDLRQSSQLEELLDVADGSDWLPLVLSDELAATAAADALGLGAALALPLAFAAALRTAEAALGLAIAP